MKHLRLKKNKSGFTLLEIIIVLIILGVLASLALPRLFSTVEFSRSAEAMASFASIRSSMERCFLANANTFVNCGNGGFNEIDVTDPGNSPNAHFAYTIAVTGANDYTITATRNTNDGGTAGDTVVLTHTAANITRGGTTAFEGVK